MTILVGYAPSKAADAALDTALDIARSTGERVVVVNAGPGGEHRTKSLVTEEQQRGVQARLDASGVTHADRLFSIEPLPVTLTFAQAAYAVVEPARRVEVAWEPEAVAAIVQAANAYPAHLQVFASEAWHAAPGPDTVTLADATDSRIARHGPKVLRAHRDQCRAAA